MIHESDRPRVHPAILYRELNTGCLLYHPDTNEVHVLNLTAAYIFNACDGRIAVSEIAAQVAELCHLRLQEALQDVGTVLRDLHARKLLL